jgi:hypothetical protein
MFLARSDEFGPSASSSGEVDPHHAQVLTPRRTGAHSERGRHLSLMMPGGFEAFFEEAAIAMPSADPRNEMGRLAAVAALYGVELLGPPPG